MQEPEEGKHREVTNRSLSKQDRSASEEQAESKREEEGKKSQVGRSPQN